MSNSEQEVVDYIFQHVPCEVAKNRLSREMWTRKCNRPGMKAWFEVFTEFEQPARTRLHLPMACQVRTYAAIWLSRFLRENFFCENGAHLLSVFRDQVIFWNFSEAPEPPFMEVARCDSETTAPHAWQFGEEIIKIEKLKQQFEAAEPTTKTSPEPPTFCSFPVVPVRKIISETERLALIETIAVGKKCVFVQGKAWTGKSTFITGIEPEVPGLIPRLEEMGISYVRLAPTWVAADHIGGMTSHKHFGLCLPKEKLETEDSLKN